MTTHRVADSGRSFATIPTRRYPLGIKESVVSVPPDGNTAHSRTPFSLPNALVLEIVPPLFPIPPPVALRPPVAHRPFVVKWTFCLFVAPSLAR